MVPEIIDADHDRRRVRNRIVRALVEAAVDLTQVARDKYPAVTGWTTNSVREKNLNINESASIKRPIERGVNCFCRTVEV